MAHALKIDRGQILSHPELFDETNPEYLEMVKRRLKHEPIAYITGYQPFFGLDIMVDRNVLVPRPETEEMVEIAEKFLKNKKGLVYDIGTGSGAIAVCLARRLPGITVVGTDSSPGAIGIAKKNAAGLDCQFIVADLFEGLTGPAQMIISNPPTSLPATFPG